MSRQSRKAVEAFLWNNDSQESIGFLSHNDDEKRRKRKKNKKKKKEVEIWDRDQLESFNNNNNFFIEIAEEETPPPRRKRRSKKRRPSTRKPEKIEIEQNEQDEWELSDLYIGCKRAEAQYRGVNVPKMLLSWFIRYSTQDYSHTELVFKFIRKDDPKIMRTESFGASCGNVLSRYKHAKFSDGTWIIYKINAPEESIISIYNWSADQLNKPMNMRGLLCNFVPVLRWIAGKDGQQNSYFCSEFVMHALKREFPDQFADTIPHLTTPRMLIDIAAQIPTFFIVSDGTFGNIEQLRAIKLDL